MIMLERDRPHKERELQIQSGDHSSCNFTDHCIYPICFYYNQWNNFLIFSLKHMMYWASFFLFLIASGIVGQIPSYTVNQGCPITQPLPAHSCLGRNTSTCWSPGVKDVDCPDHGLCCFDGCANVCDRYYFLMTHLQNDCILTVF